MVAVANHAITKRRKVVVLCGATRGGEDGAGESVGPPRRHGDFLHEFHPPRKENNNDCNNNVECYECDPEDSLLSVVQQLVRNSEAGVKKPPANHPRGASERIILLKDEIQQLVTMKQRINELVDLTIQDIKKRKEEEMRASFDTFSPLLAVGPTILSNIMDYMDEGSLFQFERASYTINELAHRCGHWQRLYKLYQNKGIPRYYDNCVSRELEARPDRFDAVRKNKKDFLRCRSSLQERKAGRCRFFGAMADQALRFERWGETHYNYDLSSSRTANTNITPLEVSRCTARGCQCLLQNTKEDWGMSQSGATFLRLSRCEVGGNEVVWQGFVPIKFGRRSGYDLYLTGRLQWMDWPELKEYFSFMNQSHYYTAEEESRTLSNFRALVEKVRITIVRGDGVLDVLTGGCSRVVKHGEAYLHPCRDGSLLDTDKISDCHSSTSVKSVKLCFRDRNLFLNVSEN